MPLPDPVLGALGLLPVTITEMGYPGRFILLAGRDAPEQGVRRTSRQRAVQTHYPGSKKASVQFMGTADEPIVLRGWFQDPLSFLDGGPAARVSMIRGMQQGGRLCQLVWGDDIVCTGRIAQADFEYFLATRVRYEITFAVDQGNEAVALAPNVGFLVSLKTAIDTAIQLAELALEVVDTIKTVEGVTGGNGQ